VLPIGIVGKRGERSLKQGRTALDALRRGPVVSPLFRPYSYPVAGRRRKAVQGKRLGQGGTHPATKLRPMGPRGRVCHVNLHPYLLSFYVYWVPLVVWVSAFRMALLAVYCHAGVLVSFGYLMAVPSGVLRNAGSLAFCLRAPPILVVKRIVSQSL
jgi:hypothetical protein